MNGGNRKPGYTIQVNGLSPSVRKTDLQGCFGEFGQISRIDLIGGKAYLEFDEKLDSEDAIRTMHGKSWMGSTLRVEVKPPTAGRPGATMPGRPAPRRMSDEAEVLLHQKKIATDRPMMDGPGKSSDEAVNALARARTPGPDSQRRRPDDRAGDRDRLGKGDRSPENKRKDKKDKRKRGRSSSGDSSNEMDGAQRRKRDLAKRMAGETVKKREPEPAAKKKKKNKGGKQGGQQGVVQPNGLYEMEEEPDEQLNAAPLASMSTVSFGLGGSDGSAAKGSAVSVSWSHQVQEWMASKAQKDAQAPPSSEREPRGYESRAEEPAPAPRPIEVLPELPALPERPKTLPTLPPAFQPMVLPERKIPLVLQKETVPQDPAQLAQLAAAKESAVQKVLGRALAAAKLAALDGELAAANVDGFAPAAGSKAAPPAPFVKPAPFAKPSPAPRSDGAAAFGPANGSDAAPRARSRSDRGAQRPRPPGSGRRRGDSRSPSRGRGGRHSSGGGRPSRRNAGGDSRSPSRGRRRRSPDEPKAEVSPGRLQRLAGSFGRKERLQAAFSAGPGPEDSNAPPEVSQLLAARAAQLALAPPPALALSLGNAAMVPGMVQQPGLHTGLGVQADGAVFGHGGIVCTASGEWLCPRCRWRNFATRRQCVQCKLMKPMMM